MFTTNKYDKLQAKLKKLRNKSANINEKANRKVGDLQAKISHIKYVKDVKCEALNNKVIDYEDLVQNEVERIYRDNEDLLKLKVLRNTFNKEKK